MGLVRRSKAKGFSLIDTVLRIGRSAVAIVKRAPYVDLVFGPQTLHRLPDLIRARREQDRLATLFEMVFDVPDRVGPALSSH